MTTTDEQVASEGRSITPSVTHRRLAYLRPSAVAGLISRHRLFSVVLLLAALLRADTMLGYWPAVWFNDSFDYLNTAMKLVPDPLRPDGYSFFLWALKPFHSFVLIVALQHLMGLSIGVMIYALLRRRFGLPAWGATLATILPLFDAYQIQLEHLILSDTLFGFLFMILITVVLWKDRSLTWKVAAALGFMTGFLALVRSVGEPILVGVVIYFLIRRIRWRIIVSLVVACAIPLVAYAGWFYAANGQFGLTNSQGAFLYVRVSKFIDCQKVNPPVAEYPLCKQTRRMRYPEDAIWNRDAPFHRLPQGTFTATSNKLAQSLAIQTIIAQPGDYAQSVAGAFARSFYWDRPVYPDPATYAEYQFGKKADKLPEWTESNDATAAQEAHAYERGDAQTQLQQPFATIIRVYQKYFFTRGAILGIVLLIGLGGLIARWRRWGGPAFLPWAMAAGLLFVPAATVDFDYRYMLPTIPLACIAAAMAFIRRDPPGGQDSEAERAETTAS